MKNISLKDLSRTKGGLKVKTGVKAGPIAGVLPNITGEWKIEYWTPNPVFKPEILAKL